MDAIALPASLPTGFLRPHEKLTGHWTFALDESTCLAAGTPPRSRVRRCRPKGPKESELACMLAMEDRQRMTARQRRRTA